MFCLLQDILFRESVSDLVLLDNDFFLQDLDGVEVIRGFLAAQNDFPKGSLSEHFDELKVFQGLETERGAVVRLPENGLAAF